MFADMVKITWSATNVATAYKVYRAASPSGVEVSSASTTSTNFNDTTAVPGVTYTYWVAACFAKYCGDASATDNGWRNLSAPVNISASDGTFPDKVRVTWGAVSGATSYEVFRSNTINGPKTLLGKITTTAYDDRTAVARVTYYYWVKACRESRSGDFSNYDAGRR